jgi:heme-degrading monooxygenase HmoA
MLNWVNWMNLLDIRSLPSSQAMKQQRRQNMYARLIQFKMGPGTRSTAEAIIADRGKALSEAKGMISSHFVGDDATGEYGVFVLWESQEDAEAFFKVSFPVAQQALKGLLEEPAQVHLYEVIEVVEPA